jgi:hypothetical protein
MRNAAESVKEFGGLRPDILFVKIRGVVVAQGEKAEIHFFPFDDLGFHAGPRGSRCRGRGGPR